MNAVDTTSFETDAHARVFRYVERRGAVDPDEIGAEVPLDAAGADEVISDLERAGYLSEFDGTLQLALGDSRDVTRRQDGHSVTVGPGRQEELPAVADTIRYVVAEVRYPRAETLLGTLQREGLLKRHDARRTQMVFTATVGGETVGWVHLGASALQRSRRTGEGTVGVRDGFRRRGIGTRLLRRGCEWAGLVGFRKVCQRLPAVDGRAVAFLESAGWELEAIRRNRYTRGGTRIDEVKMATDL